jgi:hypothetical protein
MTGWFVADVDIPFLGAALGARDRVVSLGLQ